MAARKRQLRGWNTAVILAAMVVAASLLLWAIGHSPTAPSRANSLIARAPPVRDLVARTPLPAGPLPHVAIQGVPPSVWDERFDGSTDYFAFVSSAALPAYKGDGRAQYRIWEALSFCYGELGVLRILGGGDVYKALQEQLDNPYMPQLGKEHDKIRFKRCEGFLAGNAFASLPPRAGGYPREYWADRAAQSGDALAQIETVSADLRRLGAAGASRAKLEAGMETYEARALSSRDPAALMKLGGVLVGPSPLLDSDAALALQVAACETGFDCSLTNPHFGFCLHGQDDCYMTGTWEDLLQQGSGAAGYAKLFAEAQDIEDLLQRGEADVVVKKYLAMK